MPSVSVVMPARNAAATIGAAASSVLWQTYGDLELLVIDDGSTDATPHIVSALTGPVRLITQPPKGVAAARNRGIEEAAGGFVAFCDADDILFAEHLEALMRTHTESGLTIATANAFWLLPGGVDRRRTRHKGSFPRPADQRMAILHQNFVSTMSLFPRSLADEIGGFSESLTRAEDWDFWIRAILAGHRVAHQPRPLALYRWSDSGLSSARDEFHVADRNVLARVAERDDLSASERAYVDVRLSARPPRELASEADRALRHGDYRLAARRYREAAQLCPSETMLVRKARLMAVAPGVSGRVLRYRQVRIERSLGFGERHVR